MWNIPPYEIGLGEGECITNFSNLTDSSVTNSGKLRFCKPFPLETIFMSFTLFFEMFKTLLFVCKRIKTNNKNITVQKKVSVNDKIPLPKQLAPATHHQQASHISKSIQVVEIFSAHENKLLPGELNISKQWTLSHI